MGVNTVNSVYYRTCNALSTGREGTITEIN